MGVYHNLDRPSTQKAVKTPAIRLHLIRLWHYNQRVRLEPSGLDYIRNTSTTALVAIF